MGRLFLLILLLSGVLLSCEQEELIHVEANSSGFNTRNTVIVIIDGPRRSETWDDMSRHLIPRQDSLSKTGVLLDNFFNNGDTYTVSGHSAITTGFYEPLVNKGSELPAHPSIFQIFLKNTQLPPSAACLITSKTKLNALYNTKNLQWKDSYIPTYDIEDRPDSVTFERALTILEEDTPKLSLIHFKGPDANAHAGDWNAYLNSIVETDYYVSALWKFLQENEHYKNTTALIVSNDHGRHLDNVATGFKDHGDRCQGCRHISLLALGPDFNTGVITESYEQIDIAPTIATLMGIEYTGEGRVINELFK